MSARRTLVALAAPLLLATSACASADRPPDLPGGRGAHVLLLGAPLPPTVLGLVSRHTWFAVRHDGESRWETWEIDHDDAGPGTFHHVVHFGGAQEEGVGGGPARILASWTGSEASRFIALLEKTAPRYPDRKIYVPYPGPNCNSFTDSLLREGGLAAELPATAVGKDFRGFFGAGLTTKRTGVQVETPVLGLKLGLEEGVELHLFSLTFGLGIWPPCVKVPFGEGTYGPFREVVFPENETEPVTASAPAEAGAR